MALTARRRAERRRMRRLEVDRLHLTPRVPASWPGFKVHYRHGDTVHHIEIVRRGAGDDVTRVTCDGVERERGRVARRARAWPSRAPIRRPRAPLIERSR